MITGGNGSGILSPYQRCQSAAAGCCLPTPLSSSSCRHHSSASSSLVPLSSLGAGGGTSTGIGGPGSVSSLMSSHSSIVTDGGLSSVPGGGSPAACSPPGPRTPQTPRTIADRVVGDLLIPDEMREFINETYRGIEGENGEGKGAGTPPDAVMADSTVADSPGGQLQDGGGTLSQHLQDAEAVLSAGALPHEAPPDPVIPVPLMSDLEPPVSLSSCMYAGRSYNWGQPPQARGQPHEAPLGRGNWVPTGEGAVPQPQRSLNSREGFVRNLPMNG